MAEYHEKAIADLQAKIKGGEAELAGLRQAVNQLCQLANIDPIYSESKIHPETEQTAIQPDTFYGQPLNGSMKKVLEMRKAANLGPAAANEIYEVLRRGGYRFGAKSRENAIRGVRVSLSKSTHTFHKLPNGWFGLREWYPDIKDRKENGVDAKEGRNNEGSKGQPGGPDEGQPGPADEVDDDSAERSTRGPAAC